MKLLANLASVLVLIFLCGCDSKKSDADTHVFMVAAFKMEPLDKVPTTAELAALRAFVLTIYNPDADPSTIDDSTLEKIGFQLLAFLKTPTRRDGAGKIICAQPLSWGSEPGRSLKILWKPKKDRVDLYADGDQGSTTVSDFDENFIGVDSSGAYVFDGGLVYAWATKPIRK